MVRDTGPGSPTGSGFQRLAIAAVVAAGATMLLGVYTAGVGAGLACSTRWPFCDGAVLGLFPANWPSFWEWFHRLVAMVTGVVLVGTAVAAWRSDQSARIRAATGLAVVLLPVQVALGAVTVRIEGLFPWGYSPPIQALHFLTALSIFTLLVTAAALSLAPRPGRVRRGLFAATALVPVTALFGYGTLFVYTPAVQAIYYGLSLLAYALVVAAALRVPGTTPRRLAAAGGVAFAVLMLLGRRLLGALQPLYADVTTGLLLALLLAAAWLARRDGPSAGPTSRVRESD
jgi:cytochrome c oxidase assembly protein subunit 15